MARSAGIGRVAGRGMAGLAVANRRQIGAARDDVGVRLAGGGFPRRSRGLRRRGARRERRRMSELRASVPRVRRGGNRRAENAQAVIRVPAAGRSSPARSGRPRPCPPRSAAQAAQSATEPVDHPARRLGDLVRIAGKADAAEALAAGAEGRARRCADARLVDQPHGQRAQIGETVDGEEQVERRLRLEERPGRSSAAPRTGCRAPGGSARSGRRGTLRPRSGPRSRRAGRTPARRSW